MSNASFLRRIAFAVICGVGSLMLPQLASANTYHLDSTSTASLDFSGLSSGVTYTDVSIPLSFGADVLSSGESFSMGLYDSAHNLLSSQSVSGNGSSSVNVDFNPVSLTGTSFSAVISNIVGTFDLITPVSATLTDSSGTSTTVDDYFAVTPIPASLPLFLTGAGLLYLVTRRRRKSTQLGWGQTA